MSTRRPASSTAGTTLKAILQRASYTGADGSLRLLLRPDEGEYVCPSCDTIEIACRKPRFCPECGIEGMETLQAPQLVATKERTAMIPARLRSAAPQSNSHASCI